ncbi:MAG: radical SAM protein [Planctomycetota bacterium]|nr:radical SAM protein [Planctomycetota bacterium]
MINISKLYCGVHGQSDYLRYSRDNTFGPVAVYNCTKRCNLKCLHCYSSSKNIAGDNEMTTVEAKRLLSDLAEIKCPVVLFSGGEPLLREDLFELLAHAKRIGLRTVISTNGTLIDSQTAQKMAQAGVSYAGVSIDGDEKFHDEFRVAKGSFKAAMEGIENCRKAGLKTGLRFTMTNTNADHIPFVFDIAVSAGVRRICFYHLIHTGRAKELTSPMTQEQTRRAIDTIIEKTDGYVKKGLLDEVFTVGNHADAPYLLVKMAREHSRHYESAKELLLLNGGNKTGEKIAGIGWDGNVYADQFWRNYSLGDIRKNSFRQIWENPNEPVLKKLRNKSRFADKRCLTCKWFELCKGNFRFLGEKSDDEYWLNEPVCYLTDEEITRAKTMPIESARSF